MVANGENRKIILKNLGYSYLFTSQYEEAKKTLFEFANNDFKSLSEKLSEDIEVLKTKGYQNPDCDRLKNEVNAKMEQQAKTDKQTKMAEQAKEDEETRKQNQAASIATKQNEISSKHSEFEKHYVEHQQIKSIIDGKPLNVDTYPKGKHIYEKCEQVYQEKIKLLNLEKSNDKILTIENDILKLLDKLISLESTDTKDINKLLKKAETTDAVLSVMGL